MRSDPFSLSEIENFLLIFFLGTKSGDNGRGFTTSLPLFRYRLGTRGVPLCFQRLVSLSSPGPDLKSDRLDETGPTGLK